MTWKSATVDELSEYYSHEFEQRFTQIPSFILDSAPKQIALAFPEAYPIKGDRIPPKDFIRRDTFSEHDALDQWAGDNSILNFIQSPAENDPLEGDHQLASPELVDEPALPEAVYFSADFVDRNWALIVDIDAKDVALEWATETLGAEADELTNEEIKTEAGVIDAEPAGFPYRFEDIDQAIEYGFEVQDYFHDRLDTTDTQVVYSGQGCHVYMHDPDKMYRYSETNRRFIVDRLIHELGIPIDKPVSTDEKRVIRLPYSLHADVSRVVTPIYDADFDYRKDAKPQFLKSAQEQY